MQIDHEFDHEGIKFLIKFLVIVALLVVGVRYGSAYVFEKHLVDADTSDLTEEQIAEVRKGREARLREELATLARLKDPNRVVESQFFREYLVGEYIPDEGKFILADLSQMKLYLYEDSVPVGIYDVLSKGKVGSRWQTPTGNYEVLTKERNHLSSIGGVYMPYSMQFFGNFFIHGWPYYPNGAPVASGYSGGCIRLSTRDAEEIYNFVDKGTGIYVYDGPITEHDALTVKVRNISAPPVSAKAVLVADLNSDAIYYSKNADTSLPIASLSKLLTALVANETISFDTTIFVSDNPSIDEGNRGKSRTGEVFFVGDLMYPLLMESDNYAAHSLSSYYGDDQFVAWMNKKAHALGMSGTQFEDASGLSENNVSTVNDLFRLARYLNDKQSFVLEIGKKKEYAIKSYSGNAYVIENINEFAGVENFIGGKTGYTEAALETMLSINALPVVNGTTTIATIVLGSSDRENDTRKLLSWFNAAAVATDDDTPPLLSSSYYSYMGLIAREAALNAVSSVQEGLRSLSPFSEIF